MRHAHALSLVGMLAALAVVGPVHAEPSMADKSESHALFEKALSEYKAQNWSEALKHFLASQEKDPGVGTLLYLGECYKQLGKHASAWGAFKEAISLAQKLSDKRIDLAKQKAADTEAVLSYLTIDVPEAARVDGLEVKRDGKVVSSALWGSAVPVDGGALTIDVSAPGHEATSQKVIVAATNGKARHVVAKLTKSAAGASAGTGPAPGKEPPRDAAGGAGESGPYRTPALVGVGLGLVVGVYGGYKMVTAASKADDSRANSDQAAYRSAKSESNTGLLLAIGGGVVAAGSFTVFLVDPGGKKVAVAPVGAPGYAGLSAGGRF